MCKALIGVFLLKYFPILAGVKSAVRGFNWFNLFVIVKDLRAAFQKIDYDRNGFVTRPEFRRILDSFMIMLSDEEFDKLMTRLDIQKGARLNYREFLKRFQHVETVEDGHPWLYSTHRYFITTPWVLHIGITEYKSSVNLKAIKWN